MFITIHRRMGAMTGFICLVGLALGCQPLELATVEPPTLAPALQAEATARPIRHLLARRRPNAFATMWLPVAYASTWSLSSRRCYSPRAVTARCIDVQR